MQYAEVLIKQKTKKWDATFTYGIKPEILGLLKIGSIVGVPFGRQREIEGVVVGLKRGLPHDLKGQVKNIVRVLQASVKISPEELECAKWLARFYLTSWSDALFAMLPPIPKRDIALIDDKSENNVSENKIALVCETDEKRYKIYAELIKKNKTKGKTTMLIFPDFMKLKSFVKSSSVVLDECSVISYHSGEKITGRFEKWTKIRSGQTDVVLASRMGLMCKMGNTATVIIDEPNHSGHDDDQAPRYNSLEVARFWQRKLNFNILLGDIIPSPRQLIEAKEGKLILMQKKWMRPKSEIQVVDMNKEKRAISHELELMIEEVINKKETMVLMLPRRGSVSVRYCKDCGYNYHCPNCELVLHYDDTKKVMECKMCGYSLINMEICPNCKGSNIKVGNFGIEKVSEWIKKEIGDRYRIVHLDRETKLETLPKAAIYVATQALFRYPIRPYFSAVIGTDLFLARPDYSASEETFYNLHKLAIMTDKKMLIQTQEPEHLIFRALENGKYQEFLQDLLKERRDNNYPPYGQIMKITVEDLDENKAKKDCNLIAKEISEIIRNVKIFGPVPSYFPSEKRKYRYNLIVKSEKKLDREIFRKFMQFGKVDFDPRSLL